MGAEVKVADSAAEAMTAVAAFQPQLLLCDIAMPGEDGYAFIRRLRALGVDGGGEHARARADRARDRRRSPALAGGRVSDAPDQAGRHRPPVRGGGRAGGAPARELHEHGHRERDRGRTRAAATATSIPPRCSRSCGTPSPRCSAPPPPPRSCGARPGAPRRRARSSSTSSSVARSSSTVTRCRTPGPQRPGAATPEERAPIAFRALVAEIGRLLVELTGHRLHRPARADPRASRPRAACGGPEEAN